MMQAQKTDLNTAHFNKANTGKLIVKKSTELYQNEEKN
tara:strand:+ start:580 stop:693 length:114 start_codon:yes stop_codon:yes gene_type:complete